MNRRRKDLQGIDINVWPTVDTNALSTALKTVFSNRRQAIELYASGVAVRNIEKQIGINGRQLYRLLDRCLKESDDGPILMIWLRQQIRDHAVVLEQLITESGLRPCLTGLSRLHQNFLKQCRAVGITAADYRLNIDRMGVRSL